MEEWCGVNQEKSRKSGSQFPEKGNTGRMSNTILPEEKVKKKDRKNKRPFELQNGRKYPHMKIPHIDAQTVLKQSEDHRKIKELL